MNKADQTDPNKTNPGTSVLIVLKVGLEDGRVGQTRNVIW